MAAHFYGRIISTTVSDCLGHASHIIVLPKELGEPQCEGVYHRNVSIVDDVAEPAVACSMKELAVTQGIQVKQVNLSHGKAGALVDEDA